MVRNVGRNGYSYSSSMTESYGYFLDLRYSEIGPNNNSSRAFGLQTRCLQE
ncbi:MAG: hypothetical protein K2G93_02245 [Rikenella sp.]|nr:hypothetical protein [Rikenella sp.]